MAKLGSFRVTVSVADDEPVPVITRVPDSDQMLVFLETGLMQGVNLMGSGPGLADWLEATASAVRELLASGEDTIAGPVDLAALAGRVRIP